MIRINWKDVQRQEKNDLIDWKDVSGREKGEMTEEKWFESIEKMPEDKRKMKLERNKTWLRIIKF